MVAELLLASPMAWAHPMVFSVLTSTMDPLFALLILLFILVAALSFRPCCQRACRIDWNSLHYSLDQAFQQVHREASLVGQVIFDHATCWPEIRSSRD